MVAGDNRVVAIQQILTSTPSFKHLLTSFIVTRGRAESCIATNTESGFEACNTISLNSAVLSAVSQAQLAM